jgi:hypothetical protein
MVPEHNDERWLMDDAAAEHTAAAGGASGSGKRKKGAAHQAPVDLPLKELQAWAAAVVAAEIGSSGKGGASKLPLQLAPNLVLLSLGRIEFLHPAFHNDKSIFPVGFAVRRRASTALSGGRVIWHTAEVVEAPDGSGPLFRCGGWREVCGRGGRGWLVLCRAGL